MKSDHKVYVWRNVHAVHLKVLLNYSILHSSCVCTYICMYAVMDDGYANWKEMC